AVLAGSSDPRGRCDSLRELNLSGSGIGGDAGFKSLLNSPLLNNLRSLDVSNVGLSIHSARAFADDSGLPALTELNLAGNSIGPDGTLILVHKPHAGRLHTLNLNSNGVA